MRDVAVRRSGYVLVSYGVQCHWSLTFAGAGPTMAGRAYSGRGSRRLTWS